MPRVIFCSFARVERLVWNSTGLAWLDKRRGNHILRKVEKCRPGSLVHLRRNIVDLHFWPAELDQPMRMEPARVRLDVDLDMFASVELGNGFFDGPSGRTEKAVGRRIHHDPIA